MMSLSFTGEASAVPAPAGARIAMQCKACSTRIDPGHSVCPNCGRATAPKLTAEPTPAKKRAKVRTQGKAARVKVEAVDPAVSSNDATVRVAAPKAVDLELEELAEEMIAVGDATDETIALMEPPHAFGVKPGELRAILADQPELLGENLSVVAGERRGVRYPTDVGEIDLLLVDGDGNLVVVLIPDLDSASDPVSDVLQRIGWVRKHVAKGEQEVGGIVLLPPMSDDLSYAAAAVAGTVAFRTYRMEIFFDELAL